MSDTPLVWLTRAVPTVELMRQAFEDKELATFCEPLMAIEPIVDKQQIADYQAFMATFESVDCCIFISANAVAQLKPLLSDEQLAQLSTKTVFAVGKATQKALQAMGVDATAPPKQTSSEALLALDELQQVQGQTVYIFRGVGGRGYLQQVLTERGALVEHVEVYQRTRPSSLSAQWQHLYQQNQLAAVVIGSIETFENLLFAYPEWDRSIPLVAPSERVSDFLLQHDCSQVFVSPTAHNSDMVATAQLALHFARIA